MDEIRTRGVVHESHQLHIHILQDGYEKQSGQTGVDLGLFHSYQPKLIEFGLSITKAKASDNSLLAIDLLIIDQYFESMEVSYHEKGIPIYHFNAASARGFLLKALLIDENCPTFSTEQDRFEIWDKPENGLQPLFNKEKELYLGIKKYIALTEGVIINSVRELEEDTLVKINASSIMKNKKVFMVGPLTPDEKEDKSTKTEHNRLILAWMGSQAKHSVIYISFGTVAIPPPEQVFEIGRALLLTKKPFVWSLGADQHQYLPAEIRSQIKGQLDSLDSPFLILTWVPLPQPLMLAHPSTGAFFSHCGWNSSLEALCSGAPVIGWPMFAEQGINGRWLADNGAGLVLGGTGFKPERIIPAEEISPLIEAVIGKPEYRENAAKWGEVLKDASKVGGSSDQDLKALMDCI